MIEKITRRVSSPTTFLSSLLSFGGFPIVSFATFLLNTKNLRAKTKLVKIRITKIMTSHTINTFTSDNYDY